MNRDILLIEPNYRNKYPPMGLMKISTYHKMLGDNVRFYKGDFLDFILEDIYSSLVKKLTANYPGVQWADHKALIIRYIKNGKKDDLERLMSYSDQLFIGDNFLYFRDYFKNKTYLSRPKWDRIYITTLFTFHWKLTIDTINNFKQLCKDESQVIIGGIASSLVPEEIEKETGIKPLIGLLDKPGMLDDENEIIVDCLPLDYSILHEIDYTYPENDGYYGYMTRGCVNKCAFCAVPKLEPEYIGYIGIQKQIEETDKQFGTRRHLLLLDNNVFASKDFDKIIDEIKACGFYKGATCNVPPEYHQSINGLKSGYNDFGYTRSIIKQYQRLLEKVPDGKKEEITKVLIGKNLLSNGVRKEDILGCDEYFSPLFKKYFPQTKRQRYVDFNQGVDARLATEERIKKLSEIPIKPLRIAFDNWSSRDTYREAIERAAKYGITNLSNYLLYNFNDKPIDLYYRLEMNVLLAEELNVRIYSFPMKYHPIQDPAYFRSRDYLGKHWNRKFIRSIQAILNSTKGKIGCGKSYFYEAFGKDEDEFFKLMYMPESMIIYRFHYKENGETDKWWNEFCSLSDEQWKEAKKLIEDYVFTDIDSLTDDPQIKHLLQYYSVNTTVVPEGYSKKVFKKEST